VLDASEGPVQLEDHDHSKTPPGRIIEKLATADSPDKPRVFDFSLGVRQHRNPELLSPALIDEEEVACFGAWGTSLSSTPFGLNLIAGMWKLKDA